MDQSDVNLLDLPNEILLIIFSQLSNVEVLYLLLNINNRRMDMLAREKIFSTTLNFSCIDDDSLFDRFCVDILPKINNNVERIIVESLFIERILLANIYPNLNELKLLNFEQQIVLKYFTGKYTFKEHLRFHSFFFRRFITAICVSTTNYRPYSC